MSEIIKGEDRFASQAAELNALQQEQQRVRLQSAMSMAKILCHVADKCKEIGVFLRVRIGMADTGRQSWGTAILAPLYLEFGPNGLVRGHVDDAHGSGPQDPDVVPDFERHDSVSPHQIVDQLERHGLEKKWNTSWIANLLINLMLRETDVSGASRAFFLRCRPCAMDQFGS